MGFITSRSTVTRHGVFGEERRPNPVIEAIGQGTMALVGQFPWGPADSVIKPTDPVERLKILAPGGMDRTGSGYLSMIAKAFTDLHIVRVLGSAAVAASAALPNATPATVITVGAKYKGTAGNSINCIVSAATDGDANHFNLEVQVTGASGTTSDIFENLNYSGTGADSTPDLTRAILTGSITKALSSRPVNGTYPMISGANGTINAARYTGVATTGDIGIALFESDPDVRGIFADDVGNTDRATVNTALAAHVLLMGDRVAIINGNSGLSSSAAITAAGLNRSTRVVYADPWVWQTDDIDGTERLIPSSSFFAAVMSQLSPSTSPAWKDSVVGEMLQGIKRLETPRGYGIGAQTQAGISTFIDEPGGGFRIEAAVVTIAPQDRAKKRLTRTRMGDYIAISVTQSLRPMVDSPNVPVNQDQVIIAVDRFLSTLKRAKDTDPNGRPHIIDYAILPTSSTNSQAELDDGDFTVGCDIKTSSGMERIFFSVRYGENVQLVQVAA